MLANKTFEFIYFFILRVICSEPAELGSLIPFVLALVVVNWLAIKKEKFAVRLLLLIMFTTVERISVAPLYC